MASSSRVSAWMNWMSSLVLVSVLMTGVGRAHALDVPTVAINNTRQGWNKLETVLTRANVPNLKKLREFAVDEKIDVSVFTQQTDVDLALTSGRSEVALADSPVAAYAVKQSEGKLKLTGDAYDSAPYGIAINKKTGLTEAIQAAVQVLMDDGTYDAILKKWGLESGAIETSKINDGVE